MKFVCRKCEAFMLFDEVEGVREDSLGVTFGCPSCGVRVSMVTNAGETQMVRTLGVRLGGRSHAPAPLELTRTSLASGPAADQETPAESLQKSMGKCPFANVVAGRASQPDAATPRGGGIPTHPATEVTWTPEAKERLERVPDFVRAFAKTMIEDMARQGGLARVDGTLMDSAKERFM